MSLGNERELQVDDLYKCLPEDESGPLGLKLQRLVKNINYSFLFNYMTTDIEFL